MNETSSNVTDNKFGTPGPEATYRENLKQGRFTLQRCPSCAAHVFPPRALCNRCGEPGLIWGDASGEGSVYAVTVVSRRESQGGDYNVVLVDLAEGVRMMSRVEGMPHDEIAIGLPVTLRIDSGGEEPVVVFDPATKGAATNSAAANRATANGEAS